MRKTALLYGVAGLLLMTAPAFAQDGTAPQTPPAAPPEEAAQPQTLSLQPGATVRGADGELGVLVGARLNGGNQQLTVRGADGTVRAVPIDGIRLEGETVVVDFTVAQFAEAETVTEPAVPATPAEPGETPATPATPAVPGNEPPAGEEPDDEADPDEQGAVAAEPARPAVPADPGVSPATPAVPATPATPPANPGEGPPADPGKPKA